MVAALGDDMKQWSSSSLSRYSTLLLRLSPRSLALISEQNLTESLTFLSQVSYPLQYLLSSHLNRTKLPIDTIN